MKIIIRNQKPTPKMERKAKLMMINKEKGTIKIPIKYDFNITPELKEETLEDFHLFCISITKDLLLSKFKTNEKGVVIYDIENLEIAETAKNLNKLFNTIALCQKNEKIKKMMSTPDKMK